MPHWQPPQQDLEFFTVARPTDPVAATLRAMVSYGENSLIAGKYRVERVLGRGGMGVVLAAEHIVLGHRVAIKLLSSEGELAAVSIERLLREGQACARLRSKHVAKVLDVGELDDGSPYLVMEYLVGTDLGALIAKRGPLPLSTAVDYLLQACEAVGEAHANGIVHRDIKPANLFLCSDAYGGQQIKVLDFGISKLALAESTEAKQVLTQTSAVMGTPLYMAPEQMKSARMADHRSDIWALGVTLYELVTGKYAWHAESLQEICVRVAADPAPRLRDTQAELPAQIDVVLARCLEKDPAARYQSIPELARALAPFASSDPSQLLARILHLSGTNVSPEATGGDDSQNGAWKPSVLAPRSWGGTGTAFSHSGRPGGASKRRALRVWIAAGSTALVGVCAALVYVKLIGSASSNPPATSVELEVVQSTGHVAIIPTTASSSLDSIIIDPVPPSPQGSVSPQPSSSSAPPSRRDARPINAPQATPRSATPRHPTVDTPTQPSGLPVRPSALPEWGGRE